VCLQESEIRWASRWDTYLKMIDDQIHWFSIVNSVMIVLFLSGMVAMIMMRTLHRDITKYNQLETSDDAQEETGWKLVSNSILQALRNCSCCLGPKRSGRCQHATTQAKYVIWLQLPKLTRCQCRGLSTHTMCQSNA
jgi:hypothetical protein